MSESMDPALLSQLADGELDADDACDVLLRTLDEEEPRRQLRELLLLRRATSSWRRRGPSHAAPPAHVNQAPRQNQWGMLWWLGSLATAALIGGVLVIGGMFALGSLQHKMTVQPAAPRGLTPEQMQQVAEVFAFHESVAGPLQWYAADEVNIRMAALQAAEARSQPVAIALRLSPLHSREVIQQQYLIVCRENNPTTVQLPGEAPNGFPLRLTIIPQTRHSKLEVKFSMVMGTELSPDGTAMLAGRRELTRQEAPLGQLVMRQELWNVAASAWPLATR